LRRRRQLPARLGGRRALRERVALGRGRAARGALPAVPRRRRAGRDAGLDGARGRTLGANDVSVLATHNVRLLAARAFERRGDYPSLFFEGRWHSSGELHDRAARLAAGLAQEGVGPGDRVVVMMENSPDVVVAYQALARAGAVVTPVIFLLPAAELRRIIVNCEPVAVLTTPALRATVEAAAEGLEYVRRIVSTGEELDTLAEADPTAIVPRADDDLAALVYTGGTTGRAKGVMLTHSNLWHAGWAGHEAGRAAHLPRALTALPLPPVYGLLVHNVPLDHQPPPPASVVI